MTPTVAITGASGFIGAAAVAAAACKGVAVVAVTRRADFAISGADVVRVDDYAETPADTGWVLVHAAEPALIADADSCVAAHERAMAATLEALLAKPFHHVLYISSAVVYAPTRSPTPLPTSAALCTRPGYARAKLGNERRVREAGGTILRLANTFGPQMARATLVMDVLDQIPGRGPLRIRDAKPVRDWIWIEDVGEAVALAALAKPGGVFNVGTGRGVSAGDLAHLALRLAGAGDRPVEPACCDGTDDAIVLDVEATHAALDWRPEVTLESGLKRLLANR